MVSHAQRGSNPNSDYCACWKHFVCGCEVCYSYVKGTTWCTRMPNFSSIDKAVRGYYAITGHLPYTLFHHLHLGKVNENCHHIRMVVFYTLGAD